MYIRRPNEQCSPLNGFTFLLSGWQCKREGSRSHVRATSHIIRDIEIRPFLYIRIHSSYHKPMSTDCNYTNVYYFT